jgi:hypothetical protein
VRKWQTLWPRRQIPLIEDLDGSEAEGTVRFRLDGTEYEIDLNVGTPRRCGMRSRHVRAAQPAGGGARWLARGGRRVPAGGVDSTEVREWANAQGVEVKDRARVPADPVARFKAATLKYPRGTAQFAGLWRLTHMADVCALGRLVTRMRDDFAVVVRLIYQMLLARMSPGQ